MKIKKKFKDKIFIEWIDACEVAGWKSFNDAIKIPEEVYCKTNGFFLNQNKDFITIAHTVGKNKNNDIMGVLHIPIKWIKNWR